MADPATIRKFLNQTGSTIVSVKFVKKDGSTRTIQFNPRDRQEVRGTGASNTNANIFRVRDFRVAKTNGGEGAWRSFDASRVINLKANGMVFDFTDS
jgi:hypothetical protein